MSQEPHDRALLPSAAASGDACARPGPEPGLENGREHVPDDELLLCLDGELRGPRAARVRSHLAACPACRGRLSQIAQALDGAAHAAQMQRESLQPAMDAAGPRALLRARLGANAAAPAPGIFPLLRFAAALAGLGVLALLALGGAPFHRSTELALPGESAGGSLRMLPDPAVTPGATRQVALADICSSGDDEVVRSVPNPVERRVLEEYGIHERFAGEFEVDYLITPGLGGSDDVRNLWPQPHSDTVWNSYVKDQLENRLHRMVCAQQISLSQAQREIANNWIEAYKKYFRTDRPLANPVRAGWAGRRKTALRRKQRWS